MDKQAKLIRNFRAIYNKMTWLNTPQMKDERFENYKSSEIHCIEHIGENGDANVTQLAESFYMTKGAISKMTKKLIKKGAIENYQKPNNKKEVYFRLTSQGEVIHEVHKQMHKKFNERDKVVFDQISEDQFDVMLNFMEKYSKHLDEEIKKRELEFR